jgi:hypothetical protein
VVFIDPVSFSRVKLRQQRRQGLGLGLQSRETRGFSFPQLGIVLQRALVDREQVRGQRRAHAHHAQGHQCGQSLYE